MEKIVHENGSITWRYESWQELLDDMARSAENPYRVDQDLEAKDRADERIWGY
jgi:hypothetical protein